MDKADKVYGVFLFTLLSLLLGFGIGGVTDPGGKYRQGQIDALTGEIKYELKVNPDSTVTWHERGE